METGLILALIGLSVAGIASVLGIWMERDPNRPPRWAIGLSVLIVAATIVSLFQSLTDAREAAKNEEDMARMLQQLDRISREAGADNPALKSFLSKEMEAQNRANPDVIEKMVNRVQKEGGNADDILARHLPASELKGAAAAKAGGTPVITAETQKLKDELSAIRTKLASAESAAKQLDAAKKSAEELAKEKADMEAKLEDLNQQVKRLEKQNDKLRGRTTAGSRWEKG